MSPTYRGTSITLPLLLFIALAFLATGCVEMPVEATKTPIDSSSADSISRSSSRVISVNTPAPIITSFSPTSGEVTTPVTIHGRGFGADPAAVRVRFGATLASITRITDTMLVTSVPLSATSGPITIQRGGSIATGAASFSVLQSDWAWFTMKDIALTMLDTTTIEYNPHIDTTLRLIKHEWQGAPLTRTHGPGSIDTLRKDRMTAVIDMAAPRLISFRIEVTNSTVDDIPGNASDGGASDYWVVQLRDIPMSGVGDSLICSIPASALTRSMLQYDEGYRRRAAGVNMPRWVSDSHLLELAPPRATGIIRFVVERH